MDLFLSDSFRSFMLNRVGDLLKNIEATDPELTCCESYLRGFQDAMKIMAGK